jgi:prepilin-type N-terminal cleavage/methylation domain-containing protein
MNTRSIARQGFTLMELMLSLIIAAIVGAALIRMSLAQARFMDNQEAWRNARGVARGGINRLVSDLRAVEASGGVTAAAAGGQDFTIRVPYAFGVMCITAGATSTVSLLPVDSAMYAAPGYSGFAYRTAAGSYNYVANTAALGVGAGATCQAALPAPQGILVPDGGVFPSINGSPVGKTIVLTGGPPLGTPVGTIVLLYRRIRYEFKASVVLPGRIGLWRTLLDGGVGATEEIAAPFDNTARVNFYVLNATPAQAAVPASLPNIRGLELVLNGASERTPGGSAAPKMANVTTSVFFENRPD